MKKVYTQRHLIGLLIILAGFIYFVWYMVVGYPKRENAELADISEVSSGESYHIKPSPGIAMEQNSQVVSGSAIIKADNGLSPNGNDYDLEFLAKDILTESLGVRIAQTRTNTIISKLVKESLEESLENLDDVGSFYYPGFFTESIPEEPFDDVQRILSNRRFIKLYDELSLKNKSEQYTYLNRALNDNLSQYQELLALYDSPDVPKEEYMEIARISDVEGRPRTIAGTRHAIQSVSLLSGVLGNANMWPQLCEAFQYPITGNEMSLDKYDASISMSLSRQPVFSVGIQAQTIWLMSQHANEEDSVEYGFNSSYAKNYVSDDMLREMNIPNYQSAVTEYDIVRTMARKPIDMSYGSHSFRLLVARVNIVTPLIGRYVIAKDN